MKKKAFRAAFPLTLPILASFLLLGMSYGFLMSSRGFSVLYPLLMSLLIFAGSVEFVTADLLMSSFNPVYAFFIALTVNARHLFYGISMLRQFRGTGWKKPYLIFGMCDESFSINCSAKIPPDVDRGWFMTFVTLLNHLYWVSGATLGGLIGKYIPFNTEGIEFVIAAMFITIFLNQWTESRNHSPALIGFGVSAACLVFLGPESFMIPSMLLTILILTAARNRLEVKA